MHADRMNISMTELNTVQKKHEHVHTGPAGTPGWAALPSDVSLPHPQQHTVHTGMMEPLSLSPVPGPDSSHHSSVSAPWFTNEPILCSVMPFLEGLTDFTSHLTQSVVGNVSGGGQVMLVNPYEPEQMFLTLKSALPHGGTGPAQGKGILGTSSQFLQHHQIACPLYECRDETANMEPQPPPAKNYGTEAKITLCESKSRKPCHCTRSQCLKLYCECFANGVMCNNCDCSNCHNNAEHEMKRHNAIKSCLGRNPDAFRSKIAGGRSGEAKGWHNKGCNCKRSGCLKNYCECYEANIKCTSSCKCVGCRNYDDSSETNLEEKTVNVKDKWPESVITPAVVEAVCGCLLAQAEKAERKAQNPVQAEHMVLDEFGRCLTQIVKAMFKN
ncbi:spexin prohormone 2 isoform X2 [Larimichthys crocea]|uniref:spexin prohormone 2 isoform X2 n=1 Tax=Larimichthys crocea TaxID=215358 RepID=UPI000900CB6E|nr:protein lin-54 homolog isoform X2 [Larimichthys crocea]TMS00861.1 Protein lin-54-like protein [Larimichthys crocea]TMS00864.1 Protein lin-54-like protein [Larimichthys crocea]